MSLDRLPGTPASAEFVLHKVLDHLEQVEHVMVVVKWKDGPYQTCWSSQPLVSLATAALTAHARVSKEFVE